MIPKMDFPGRTGTSDLARDVSCDLELEPSTTPLKGQDVGLCWKHLGLDVLE